MLASLIQASYYNCKSALWQKSHFILENNFYVQKRGAGTDQDFAVLQDIFMYILLKEPQNI